MRELLGRSCTGAIVLLAVSAAFAAVEPLQPLQMQAKHPAISSNVAKLIEELHYSQPHLDNSLSSAILDRYLDTLDGNRMYFTAGDVASFNRLRYELDDRARSGELQPVFDIFNVFRKRAGERVEYAIKLLETEPDYKLDETYRLGSQRAALARVALRDRRSLAPERQERRPAPHAHGQDMDRDCRDPEGALRALVQARHAAHARRRVRDVHERRRAQHGSALELSVAAPERGVSDSDEPVVRRHRRVAAARRRLRQGHEHHSRRAGANRRSIEARGSDHRGRRRPRRRARRRDRLASRRRRVRRIRGPAARASGCRCCRPAPPRARPRKRSS